uniref:Uncharacterized protein n=1 Tax=Syphacia muris TaxID=451379 RepID=A0A0N5ACX6_9BILA
MGIQQKRTLESEELPEIEKSNGSLVRTARYAVSTVGSAARLHETEPLPLMTIHAVPPEELGVPSALPLLAGKPVNSRGSGVLRVLN